MLTVRYWGRVIRRAVLDLFEHYEIGLRGALLALVAFAFATVDQIQTIGWLAMFDGWLAAWHTALHVGLPTVLVFVVYLLITAPARIDAEQRGKIEQLTKKAASETVVLALAELMNEGGEIRSAFERDKNTAAIVAARRGWYIKTCHFLNDNFGKVYFLRFQNATQGMPIVLSGTDPAGSAEWADLKNRLACLSEIIRELQSA